MITIPGGVIYFVEVKSPHGELTSGQRRDHERRIKLGCEVWTVYGKDDVDNLIRIIGGTNE